MTPEQYKSKTSVAREAIEQAIQDGSYGSGARFNIRKLAKDLNMSITPVREALRILQANGLVSYDEHRSISVTELTPVDVDEIYIVRSVLEGLAAEWAAQRRTDEELELMKKAHKRMIVAVQENEDVGAKKANREWHFAVYYAAHTSFLVGIISRIWTRVEWNSIWAAPGRIGKSVQEHEEITEAIIKGDRALAGQLMRDHLFGGRAAVKEIQSASEGSSGDDTNQAYWA